MSRFRRWLHLLRSGLRHRGVTAYRGFHGPATLIACDCGRIFWRASDVTEAEAAYFCELRP